MVTIISKTNRRISWYADNIYPLYVHIFIDYCRDSLDPFVTASFKLGGDAEKGGILVKELWLEMRGFIMMASKCKEPPAANMGSLLGACVAKSREISSLTKRNEYNFILNIFFHLSLIFT